MDYKVYKITAKDKLIVAVEATILSALVAYLFFDSVFGLITSPIIFMVLYKRKEKDGLIKLRQELTNQFMDTLKNISTALLAGYSVENAWKEAQREIEHLYGRNSYMYKELEEMNRLITTNIPIENILDKFAQRAGIEDISTFAEIFAFAKRSRGNFGQIIDTTTYRMCEKYETKREIEVSIASKKMEQNIMNIIPIVILAYLRLASADYMSILYGNLLGIIFMSVCLMVYVFVIYLAEKLLSIKI